MTSLQRLGLEALVALLLSGAFFGWWIHHDHAEQAIGQQKIQAADRRAQDAAKKQADAETALNLERAAKAAAGADHDQQVVDDYRASHGAADAQPVRLCHPDNRLAGMPAAGAAVGEASGPGSGSAPVREVQGGVSGPDIGAGIDAIVQAAERLAIIDAEWQRR